MALFLANIVTAIVVAFLVWRRGPDRRVGSVRSARLLRTAALVPLGLLAAVFLAFGLGEMTGGDPSGAGHLLSVAGIAVLGVLAWKRPLEAGAGLLAAGVLFAVSVAVAVPRGEGTAISPSVLILGAPQMLSGALFLIAGWLGRRAAA